MTKTTKDDDKKPFDNQASNEVKNKAAIENRKKGDHTYSKEVDHL
jgi:hypothetical protein